MPLAVGVLRIRVNRRVPLLCCGLKLLHRLRAIFSLETRFSGFQARLQRCQVAAAVFCFAQFVERFVQLENFFEQFGRSLLLVLAFLARAFDFRADIRRGATGSRKTR